MASEPPALLLAGADFINEMYFFLVAADERAAPEAVEFAWNVVRPYVVIH